MMNMSTFAGGFSASPLDYKWSSTSSVPCYVTHIRESSGAIISQRIQLRKMKLHVSSHTRYLGINSCAWCEHACVCINAHVCICVCMFACVNVYMYMCVHTGFFLKVERGS